MGSENKNFGENIPTTDQIWGAYPNYNLKYEQNFVFFSFLMMYFSLTVVGSIWFKVYFFLQ